MSGTVETKLHIPKEVNQRIMMHKVLSGKDKGVIILEAIEKYLEEKERESNA